MNRKPKKKRREQILDTALTLFNDLGSHKVATNHIAKAMGISPGNLYYHYSSKEHIIRELLKRLIAEFDALIQQPMESTSDLAFIDQAITAIGELIFAYRFVYVELAALLANDEVFKEIYLAIKARRMEDFKRLFESLAQLGVVKASIAPGELEAFVFIIWTYAEGIVTGLATSNIPITPITIKTHFKKIFFLLKAYLTAGQWEVLFRDLELSEKH
jgi:AcrR family transcriptional regulator